MSEPQRGTTDLDCQGDALRWGHRAVAVDRLGVVPGFAALRRQVFRRSGHARSVARPRDVNRAPFRAGCVLSRAELGEMRKGLESRQADHDATGVLRSWRFPGVSATRKGTDPRELGFSEVGHELSNIERFNLERWKVSVTVIRRIKVSLIREFGEAFSADGVGRKAHLTQEPGLKDDSISRVVVSAAAVRVPSLTLDESLQTRGFRSRPQSPRIAHGDSFGEQMCIQLPPGPRPARTRALAASYGEAHHDWAIIAAVDVSDSDAAGERVIQPSRSAPPVLLRPRVF